MNMNGRIIIALVLFCTLPYTATAIPGITVTVDPLSKDAQVDTTIDYLIRITNDDDSYDKTITYLGMELTQQGWTYSIDPLSTTNIPAGAGNYITTTLHVSVPSGATSGTYYSHRINTMAEYELYPGCMVEFGDPSICIFPESDPEDFNTHIIDSTQNTEIPEFPSVVFPITATLGLLFIMSRRK